MSGEGGGVDALSRCDLQVKMYLLESPRRKADSYPGSMT